MATLSVKVGISDRLHIAILAIFMLACPAGYSHAADAQAKSATQPATEIFPVKEKDLPATTAPATKASDIPLPDFKEFEDDKFINNLLGEDVGQDAPAASAVASPQPSAPAPATPPQPAATPDAIIDDMLSGNDAPKAPPAAQDLADKATSPTPAPPADKPAEIAPPPTVTKGTAAPVSAEDEAEQAIGGTASPQAVTPPNPQTDAEQPKTDESGEAKPVTAEIAPLGEDLPADIVKSEIGGAQLPDALTDAEKAAYGDLKKHLLNFIASFQTKAVAQQEPEKTNTTGDNQQIAAIPDAATPNMEIKNPPPPADAAQPAGKTAATDDFEDFLEPAKPAPAPKLELQAPDKPEVPATVATDAVANEPQTTAATPEAPRAAMPEKIQPPEIEQQEAAPQEIKEKLSEADKAYFKMLDSQREKLPGDKRLSEVSKDVMDDVSNALTPARKIFPKEPEYIKIERGTTGDPAIEEDGVTKSQNKMNLSVRKVDKNEDFEKTKVKLEKAYKALMVGQVAAAISLYKDALEKEPENKDAMFGLATAYHKNDQYEQARAIYTKLLKKSPGDKEALNNFLVLVAEEAPEDALIELEKLERINSDFSPIPAQIAMINLKLGDSEKAARYLRRAILLSPDNISYKYNLAITYDTQGKEEQAVQIYHQIIEAAQGGAVIPGSIDKLIERVTYLEGKISNKK